MDEPIDIVDSNNQPTGQTKLKVIAHQDNDWHQTTQIWVVNQLKEILINLRSLSKRQDPGKWASYFGGHSIAGENYLNNAFRETKEELGIEVSPNEFIKIELRKNVGPNEFVMIYGLIINKTISQLTQSEETQKIKFITVNDLLKWAKRKPTEFSGGQNYIINQIQNLKSKNLV